MREVAIHSGVPRDRLEDYVEFALEFHRTARGLVAPKFDHAIRTLVLKYHRRGFKGHLLWLIGSRIMDMLFGHGWERR
jgi:hypothetical protein